MRDSWQIRSIEDSCDILDNHRIPLNGEQRSAIPGGIPYYGANGVQGYISKHLFDEELILMAEDGGNFEEYSKRPIAYRISGKSWVNNHAHILRAKIGFNQNFIFYSVVNKNIIPFIKGGTRSKLNLSDLKCIEINYPPLPQQQKIAKILSTCDEVIEKTEAAITKYQALKQGMMHDLFTRGIDVKTGKLRPRFEDAPELYRESELGMIPREWEVRSIQEVSSLVTNGFVGVATPFYTNRDNGILYLFGTNIRANYLDHRDVRYVSKEFHSKHLKSQLRKGDMLTVQSGHIGTSAVIPADYGEANCHALIITRFNKEIINSDYISHYLNSALGMKRQEVLFVGSTIKHINTSDLAKHNIFIPNHREQDLAVEKLGNIQKNINLEQSTLSKYQQLKAGLMQDLLTGKVEVSVEDEAIK